MDLALCKQEKFNGILVDFYIGKNKQTLTAIGDLFHGCRFYFYRFKIKRKIATGNITMWGNCKN